MEQILADLVFAQDPVTQLETLGDEFAHTNRKQFGLFYSRLLKRIEERLSQQFGACMGLLEESCGMTADQVAKDFACSPEYRQVREDLEPDTQTSEARFEMAFLGFVLRTRQGNELLLSEFKTVFLHELAASV